MLLYTENGLIRASILFLRCLHIHRRAAGVAEQRLELSGVSFDTISDVLAGVGEFSCLCAAKRWERSVLPSLDKFWCR